MLPRLGAPLLALALVPALAGCLFSRSSIHVADIDAVAPSPRRASPEALLAVARASVELGSDAALVRLELRGVKADGTLDFLYPPDAARARFCFESSLPPPGNIPLGDVNPGGPFSRDAVVTSAGLEMDRRPFVRGLGSVAIEPNCSARQVWDSAIADGAPGAARASLHYVSKSGGGTWWFSIADPRNGDYWASVDDRSCRLHASSLSVTR
jgi:hypothetical protein